MEHKTFYQFGFRNFEAWNEHLISVMEDNLVCFDSVYTTHLDERKKCTDTVENAIKNVSDGDYCKWDWIIL